MSDSNSNGTSDETSSLSATTLPTAPTSVSASTTSLTAIAVGLVADALATSVNVYVATYGGTYGSPQNFAMPVTTCNITGLVSGTEYSFKATSVTSAGESPFSSVVNGYTYPGVPTALTADLTGGNLKLTWTGNNGSGTGIYTVQKSNTGVGGSYTTIGGGPSPTFTDTSFNALSYYQVYATVNGIDSPISAPLIRIPPIMATQISPTIEQCTCCSANGAESSDGEEDASVDGANSGVTGSDMDPGVSISTGAGVASSYTDGLAGNNTTLLLPSLDVTDTGGIANVQSQANLQWYGDASTSYAIEPAGLTSAMTYSSGDYYITDATTGDQTQYYGLDAGTLSGRAIDVTDAGGNVTARYAYDSPAQPVLGSATGGSLSAAVYYVEITYTTASGETLASAPQAQAVQANDVLVVASPAAMPGATGYNVYIGAPGSLTKEGTEPIGTNWTESGSGLTGGGASAPARGIGAPTEVVYTTGTTDVTCLYSYVPSGDNAGKLASIERLVGSAESEITSYDYYDTGDAHGNLGDLESATTEDGSGNVLNFQYFRYYTGEAGGAVSALKYVVGMDSYARLGAALGSGTPLTASDTDLAPYADYAYVYDGSGRVSSMVVQGAGCSSCSGGLGTTTYSYSTGNTATSSTQTNLWTNKTTITLPDSTIDTYYYNQYQQQMLAVTTDPVSGRSTATFTEYDAEARPILSADSDAVILPASLSTLEAHGDLLHYVSGNYQYLADSAGQITITDYANSTTATSSTAGNVLNFVEDTKVQLGETGTAITTEAEDYISRTATIYPVADDTLYGTNGGDARTTSYTYSWYTGTLQMKQITTTLPNIGSGQNGPNSADTQSTFFDTYGRPLWTKDGNGKVGYTAYDDASGAVIESITDVVYADLTSPQQTLFAATGWSNPSGGLNLVTTSGVDLLGRTIDVIDPDSNATVIVYDDADLETRTYTGRYGHGTATSTGSTTTLVDTNLSAGVDWVGCTLTITAGTDSGQARTVTAFNASTHTLTLGSAFSSATTSSSIFTLWGSVGPTQISRQYLPAANGSGLFYTESMTTSVAPSLSGGVPNGAESFSAATIERLERDFTNAAGQVIWCDKYSNLGNVTFAEEVVLSSGAPADLGTINANFYRTTYAYDEAGRQNKVIEPTGTIDRTVYDGFGDAVSKWVGTDDTPGSGYWSPTNNTSPSNMVDVEDVYYNTQQAPAIPSLTSVSSGSLSSTTYYVEVTYTINGIETAPSMETSISVAANKVLKVLAPTVVAGESAYNVYVSTTSGAEKPQSAPASTTTDWTESTSGITSTGSGPASGRVGMVNVTIQHPGGGADDRIAVMAFDWRGNRVLSESGLVSASNSTPRSITFDHYDNQQENTEEDQYDGTSDQFAAVGFTSGVPNTPGSTLLAKSTTAYDDQGRVYLTDVYSVTSGTATSALTTNSFYDRNGNVIATYNNGQPTSKSLYDGANRVIATYTTDGGAVNNSGTPLMSWSDAGSVANDDVVTETDTTYDGDGNPILTVTKDRLSAALSTDEGALGDPSTAPKSRDTYVTEYYDAAGRMVAEANYGTASQSAPTNDGPSGVPTRSDSTLVTSYGFVNDIVYTVTLTGSPTGGTFTLGFANAAIVINLAYNVSAATVASTIAGNCGLSGSDINVIGNLGGPFTIRVNGALASNTLGLLTATSSLTGGTSPGVSVVMDATGGDTGQQQTVTDPRGIVTRTDSDMLGNTFQTIAAYTNGTPSSDTNQTTQYSYDGNHDVLTMTAVMNPGVSVISSATESGGTVTITTSADHLFAVGDSVTIAGVGVSNYNGTFTITAVGSSTTFTYTDTHTGLSSSSGGTATVGVNQTTAYVYGVGTTLGTDLFSNDLIAKTEYPDPTTGAASTSASNDVSGTYDFVGEVTTKTDQNGSTHTYSYDTLGNMTLDAVTTLGAGVDGSIRALGYSYTALGLPYQQTSYSNSAGTTVVNQVQDAYNGLQQLTTEYQEQSGAVNTGSSLKVQYAYSTPSSTTGANLISMTYPNGRVLDYAYSSGLDSAIGRISSLIDDYGGGHLDDYTYLGLATIVGQSDGNGVAETTTLDAFGNIAEMNWDKSGSTDDFQYGYDRNGNVLYMKNVVSTAFSELYHANSATSGDDNTAYDPLNRLTGFRRGTLSSSGNNSSVLDTVTTLNSTSGLTGNSQSWGLDAVGNQTAVTTDGTTTDNTQNSQNELTGFGAATLTFDNDGNTTTDQNGNTMTYDAWNRLKTDSAGGTSYTYDADGRRTSETQSMTTTAYYLSTQNQILEERQSSTVTAQNVFSIDYVNDVLVRDDNSTSGSFGKSGSGLGARTYYQHDAVFSVTATTNTSGVVQQRFVCGPYGVQVALSGAWAIGGANSIYGFQGGRFDIVTGLNHFDDRDYNASTGVWLQSDPAGTVDGIDRYGFVTENPQGFTDPAGLDEEPAGANDPNDVTLYDDEATRQALPVEGDNKQGTVPGLGHIYVLEAKVHTFRANQHGIWIQFSAANKDDCDRCHWLQFAKLEIATGGKKIQDENFLIKVRPSRTAPIYSIPINKWFVDAPYFGKAPGSPYYDLNGSHHKRGQFTAIFDDPDFSVWGQEYDSYTVSFQSYLVCSGHVKYVVNWKVSASRTQLRKIHDVSGKPTETFADGLRDKDGWSQGTISEDGSEQDFWRINPQ